MEEKVNRFAEYEQQKISEMRETSAQRQHRKALRTSLGMASREVIPPLTLSAKGDELIFDGQAYSLFFAHGDLQIERTFASCLRKKGFSAPTRQEIHRRVKALVAASPLSFNILGQPAVGAINNPGNDG